MYRHQPLFCLRHLPDGGGGKSKEGEKKGVVWAGGDGFVSSWSQDPPSLLVLDCLRSLQVTSKKERNMEFLVVKNFIHPY